MNNTTANMPLKDSLKPSPLALLPIGVFLVIYAGSGIIFHDFYNMPAIIAFLAALLTAFLQTRTLSFSEKITVIAKGLADENIITMCLIFLTAGAFSGAVSAAGGVEHTVNLNCFLPAGLPPDCLLSAVFFPYPWEQVSERFPHWHRLRSVSVKRLRFPLPCASERSSAVRCSGIIFR